MKSTAPDGPPGEAPAVLSIGEVSQRTGMPVAGLRNWERRFGLPRPERLPNGRRRYRESDCVLLAEVLRRAARRACRCPRRWRTPWPAPVPFRQTSIFAGLRERYPALRVHVLTKTMLLALTHAIEDECCARAQRPVLVGCFQQVRFYQAARPRWADLARTAEQTVVFADFGQRRDQPGPLAEIPLAGGSPLRREWTLICDAPDRRPAWRPGNVPGRKAAGTRTAPSRRSGRSTPRWSAAPRASGPGWPPRRASRSPPHCRPG